MGGEKGQRVGYYLHPFNPPPRNGIQLLHPALPLPTGQLHLKHINIHSDLNLPSNHRPPSPPPQACYSSDDEQPSRPGSTSQDPHLPDAKSTRLANQRDSRLQFHTRDYGDEMIRSTQIARLDGIPTPFPPPSSQVRPGRLRLPAFWTDRITRAANKLPRPDALRIRR